MSDSRSFQDLNVVDDTHCAVLRLELKRLILKECDKPQDLASLSDDEQLIGGPLGLDSLDALQISLAVKERYGLHIHNGPDGRRTMASVRTLADEILAARAGRPLSPG